MAFPMEFRRLVFKAHQACGSSAEVAQQYGCSEAWVRRLVQRERESGSLEPRLPRAPQNYKLDANDMAQLEALVAARPDMTLQELADALDNKVSVPTVHRALVRKDLVLKKSRSTPPSRSGRMSRLGGRCGLTSSPMCGWISLSSSTNSAWPRT
jgi:transposase